MPPTQSYRQKLKCKGYQQYMKDGVSTFSEKESQRLVNIIHKNGFLAQSVRIAPPDGGEWWVVMYKIGKRR